MDYTDEDAQSLAEKLAALELNDAERALLEDVLEAASSADVGGFATRPRLDRYVALIRPFSQLRYIGETEKNLGQTGPGVVFEPNDEP
jgi:hypothetical protein